MNYKIELCAGLDELVLEDTAWLTLGQLRALVAEADRCGWLDNSLVSHSEGADHVRRHDIREARRIVITGSPREMRPPSEKLPEPRLRLTKEFPMGVPPSPSRAAREQSDS